MTRLTKTQLLAKIDQLESELGLANEQLRAALAERDAYLVAQRPSRRERSSSDFQDTVSLPVVVISGQRCVKRVAWEHGRRVTTYTPIAAH